MTVGLTIDIWLRKQIITFKITAQNLIFKQKHLWFIWCNLMSITTVYPKKYAHGFCFAVLCCGYTLPDFPISIRLTSLALWQSNDCPNASKATLMNMDKYFMWIHYERLHNHNKAKHNKTVCIFLGIYCMLCYHMMQWLHLLLRECCKTFLIISTLVKVTAWYRHSKSHYLSQCIYIDIRCH